jgi:hypothetical protein
MINFDYLLLDELEEDEFWLLCQVARHLGQGLGTAFPSTETLQKLCGWSDIKKVRRMRDSLVKKGIFEVSARFLPDGRQTSNEFRIIGNRIGVYLGVQQLHELQTELTNLRDQLFRLEQAPTHAPESQEPGGQNHPGQEIKGKEHGGGKILPPRGGKEITPEIYISKNPSIKRIPKKEKTAVSPKNEGKIYPPIPDALNTPEFVAAWNILLGQKKWKKKEPSAIEAALKKLSCYPPEFAAELVETAIAGEYQGVVFSSTPGDFKKWFAQNNLSNEKEQLNGRNGNRIDNELAGTYARTIRRLTGRGN